MHGPTRNLFFLSLGLIVIVYLPSSQGRRPPILAQHRRSPHLIVRQQSVSDPAIITTPATTATSPTTSPTGGSGLLDTIGSIVDPNAKATQNVSSATVSTAIPIASSSTTKPLTVASSSHSSLTTDPTVVQVTQTSTISDSSTSSSASTTATAPPQEDQGSSGGGLTKGTLIAVIIIASAVGAIAAIWTIIRKWKLSPSRRFEDKLNPIDFVDEYGQPNRVPSVLSRTGSNASEEMLHKRNESWGSGHGSQRGPMSEASYGARAVYPPPSQTWPPVPASNPYAQPPVPLVNPYEYGQSSNSLPYRPSY